MGRVRQPGLVSGLVGYADEEHDVGFDAGHELDVFFGVEGLLLRCCCGGGCCRRGCGGGSRFGSRVVLVLGSCCRVAC